MFSEKDCMTNQKMVSSCMYVHMGVKMQVVSTYSIVSSPIRYQNLNIFAPWHGYMINSAVFLDQINKTYIKLFFSVVYIQV